MSATGTIRCGAITKKGFCTRRLHPGERCVDHGILAPPDSTELKRLEPEPCHCPRPIRWVDDLGVRCIKCGRNPDLEAPLVAREQPRQLELEL